MTTDTLDLTVLDDVPHAHPAGFPCLACGRDAAEAAVAAERARIRAAVEGLSRYESMTPEWYAACVAVLAIVRGEQP